MGNDAGTLRLARDLAILEALQQAVTDSDDEEIIWDDDDKSDLMIVSDDGHTVERKSTRIPSTDGVRAEVGYTSGIHAWEITWPMDQRENYASVGIATSRSTLQYNDHTDLIGGNDESVGWNLSKQVSMYNDCVLSKYPENKPPSYKIPDKVIAVLDMNLGVLRFTVDGENLGVCASGLKSKQQPWFPAVSCENNATIKIRKIQVQSTKGRGQLTRPALEPKIGPLRFYAVCGKHIDMGGDRRSAKRENPMSVFNKAILLTCRPLWDDELFEVEITDRVERWFGTVEIGATTVSPTELNFPETMTESKQGNTWMYSGNSIKQNGDNAAEMDVDTNNLKVGDKVGVKRKKNGNLVFFVNGKLVGTGSLQTPSDIFGVVDIYGNTSGIRITSPILESSDKTQPEEKVQGASFADTVSTDMTQSKERLEELYDLMKIAIQTLSNPQKYSVAELAKVMENLEGRRSGLSTYKEKKVFGDKFAEMDGGKAIVVCMLHLRSKLKMEGSVNILDLFILDFCSNTSNSSLKFCEAIGEAGLLQHLAEDLRKLKQKYMAQNISCMKVLASIAILHHCSKATKNKEIFKKGPLLEALRGYCTSSNPTIIAAAATQALSYICLPPDIVSVENLKYLAKMLKVCTKSEQHTYDEEFRGVSTCFQAMEILESVTNLARDDKNRKHLVESEIAAPIVWMLQKGERREQEQASNAIWALTDATNRWKMIETQGLVESLVILKDAKEESLSQAAKRAYLKLTTQSLAQGIIKAESLKNCGYAKLSSRLLKSLDIDEVFFNDREDSCFCVECHAERGDQLYYSRGIPEKNYALPIGWFRCGLQVHARVRAKSVDAFKKWHRCFHGTNSDTLKNILSGGELILPGDVALGGKKVGERPGHFNDAFKPEGFNTKRIFLSPSIRYSGISTYATPFTYVDVDTRKKYVAKVALQVLIRPGSYETRDQTIGATEQIDPGFSNQELEWCTAERGATIMYGLLIKLDESLIQ